MSRHDQRRAYLRTALEHVRELQESIQVAFIDSTALTHIGDAHRSMRQIGNCLHWAHEEILKEKKS